MQQVTTIRMDKSKESAHKNSATAMNYLMLCGYLGLGYLGILVALQAITKNATAILEEFYKAKIVTTRFYLFCATIATNKHASSDYKKWC